MMCQLFSVLGTGVSDSVLQTNTIENINVVLSFTAYVVGPKTQTLTCDIVYAFSYKISNLLT